MSDPNEGGEPLRAARIPADIGKADRVIGPLTARQAAILAVTGVVLWLGYQATHPFMTPLAYLALAGPIAAVMTVLVLGRRDGLSMDRFALAAARFGRAPKRQVTAPDGIPPLPRVVPRAWAAQAGPAPAPLQLPCRGVTGPGVVELGPQGHAALATCTTVNFDLRTPAEQQGLTAGFGRWLNALTGPTQILIRAHRLDLGPLADRLAESAAGLPHPALEQAALAHAAFLSDLAAHRDLLTRHVLLIAREPGRATASGSGGPVRVRQRLEEAARALASAEISTTALDTDATVRAIREATTPETFPSQTSQEHEGAAVWASES